MERDGVLRARKRGWTAFAVVSLVEMRQRRLVFHSSLVQCALDMRDELGHNLQVLLLAAGPLLDALELSITPLEVPRPDAVVSCELAIQAEREHEDRRLGLQIPLRWVLLRERVALEDSRKRSRWIPCKCIEESPA